MFYKFISKKLLKILFENNKKNYLIKKYNFNL